MHDGTVLIQGKTSIKAGSMPTRVLQLAGRVVCVSASNCWIEQKNKFVRLKEKANSFAVVEGMLAMTDSK